MKDLLLYNLFSALRKDDRLLAGGVGEYLVMQEYMSKGFRLDSFDDFSFACETLLVKRKREQPVFRKILNDWRAEIEAYIREQYGIIEKTKNPTLPAKTTTQQPNASVEDTNAADNPAPVIPVNPQPLLSPEPVKTNGEEKDNDASSVSPDEGEMSFSLSDDAAGQDSAGRKLRPGNTIAPVDNKKTFLFGNEYFPVVNRYLRQNWRSLKNRQDINQYGTVNIKLTIDQIASTGLFTEFQYQKKTQNLLSLFIFVDRGRSMASAEAFGKELAESAFQSGTHLKVKPYYFQDVPEKSGDNENPEYYLFNEEETELITISSLFKPLTKKNIVTLVYGDAGAIYTGTNEASGIREKNTMDFIRYLLMNTAYTVWINPAPRHRWTHTTAENLSKAFPEVPMFEANNSGLDQAINALKGKLVISN